MRVIKINKYFKLMKKKNRGKEETQTGERENKQGNNKRRGKMCGGREARIRKTHSYFTYRDEM